MRPQSSTSPEESMQCACGCGQDRPKYDARGRGYRFLKGHNGRRRLPSPELIEELRRRSESRTTLVPCACGCGQLRPRLDKEGVLRKFIHGHHRRGYNHSAETRSKMAAAQKGPGGSMWKGGVTADGGYKLRLRPEHPYANNRGYVREHRLVMEAMLGRYLRPEEVVHHVDSDLSNNRPENLMLFADGAAHTRFHMEQGKESCP